MKMIDNLEQVERVLLPPGKRFSTEQTQVIGADGNIDIVAGPGSGKTTVLAAKLIMFLSKQRRGDKGICCITHTNVAVAEIKKRIEQSGLGNVEYPNFVGTIQRFFDHFFGSKAFGLLFPQKALRILDGDQYTNVYAENFLQLAPSWWKNNDYDAPDYRRREARLVISEDKKAYFVNNEHKNYGPIINEALGALLSRGIVNSEQMTELARWYISLHGNYLSTAMSERFDYLLLDEAQDTNDIQYKILMELTKGKNIHFQRFGDPYQALYTIYGSESEDAWNPFTEEQDNIAQIKEISTTARFGPGIAGLVRDVCYEKYPTFHSDISQKTFNNRFIIFESGDDLREKYQRLLRQCESENDSFLKCPKKDKIVAPMYKDLEKWFNAYKKPTHSPIIHVQPATDLFYSVLRKLAYANRRTISEEHMILQENMELAESVAKSVKCLFSKDETQTTLEGLIHPLLENDAWMTSADVSNDLIKETMHVDESNMELSNSMESEIILSTIHGVKGETHRSTLLLVDSEVYGGEKIHENFFFKDLFPFLIGERKVYDTDPHSKRIKACLKYAYVALSRPVFLAGVAIPKGSVTSTQREKMVSYGWKEVK
ncbi:UvrD-helicase domain-containing protein [Levilactobacillus hammesii]|nr:UvrD-helicase domain-containing protein [Levilactobacillus hammesii]